MEVESGKLASRGELTRRHRTGWGMLALLACAACVGERGALEESVVGDAEVDADAGAAGDAAARADAAAHADAAHPDPLADAGTADPCAADNGGCDPLALCMVSAGAALCGDCPAGYAGSGADGCEDVDECASGDARCSPFVSCENEAGGYRCGDCPAGYDDESGDGSACVDIDECQTDNGGCDALTACTNTEGGRECGACPAGFVDQDTGEATSCLLDDPALAGLELSTVLGEATPAPVFDPATLAYSLELPLSAESLSVTATLPEHAAGRAAIEVGGQTPEEASSGVSLPLALGDNAIDIVVTSESGATRTYTLNVRRWRAFGAYVKASNTGGGDRFGQRIALSGDGMTLAVGAPNEASSARGVNPANQSSNDYASAGAVYVFIRAGGMWLQQAYVKATNTGGGDQFGSSLDLSDDGNTLAVAAPLESSCRSGVRSADDTTAQSDDECRSAGAVYLYERTGSAWSARHYVKPSTVIADRTIQFGTSLALSGDGDTLAVGRLLDVDENQTNYGSVLVFLRSGSSWTELPLLRPSLPCRAFDCTFGAQMSLADDGRTLAVSSVAGVVHLYSRSGNDVRELHAIDFETALNPGNSQLALSGDGRILAVGDVQDGNATTGISTEPPATDSGQARASGAVHVFARSGASWIRTAYIKASNAGSDDNFGSSLRLSDMGDVLAVGAPFESGGTSSLVSSGPSAGDDAASSSGAVYVYRSSAGGWREVEYVKASTVDPSDLFGSAVALTEDGNVLAVGAPYEDSGATGISTASEGPGAASQLDNGAPESGAVYVYY